MLLTETVTPTNSHEWTANWHTHTARCKHASGTVVDYCAVAAVYGLTDLGISDHTPFADGRWHSVRMAIAELPTYRAEIEAARPLFPGLRLWAGLECEFRRELGGFYREVLLQEHCMDYLVGAVHWFPYRDAWTSLEEPSVRNDPKALAAYVTHIIDCMSANLFLFMAHPDAFAGFYVIWDAEAAAASRDILEAARDLGVPLEINAFGLRKPRIETPQGLRWRYPLEPFWQLAGECRTPSVVNSDAHRPEDIAGEVNRALAWAVRFNVPLVDLQQVVVKRNTRIKR
jgi:histidinol-phosphatase (PHP family)